MNKFDELKKEILAKYPSIKSLSFVERCKARLRPEHGYSITLQEGGIRYEQRAVMTFYKGTNYTKRFGALKP